MTEIIYFLNVTCTEDSGLCSEAIVAKIESNLSLKLHAVDEFDTGMHGGVNMRHTDGNHRIRVHLVDETKGRTTKIDTFPTKEQFEAASI